MAVDRKVSVSKSAGAIR